MQSHEVVGEKGGDLDFGERVLDCELDCVIVEIEKNLLLRYRRPQLKELSHEAYF